CTRFDARCRRRLGTRSRTARRAPGSAPPFACSGPRRYGGGGARPAGWRWGARRSATRRLRPPWLHSTSGSLAAGRIASVAIDFEAEGLLKGTRGRNREARLELLRELEADGVGLEE